MIPEFYAHKDMPAGRRGHSCVVPLTYGRARIVWAEDDEHIYVQDSW